jgi:Chlorophyll A-B binding protein
MTQSLDKFITCLTSRRCTHPTDPHSLHTSLNPLLPCAELINGRAAMLGVVAAAISEVVTGQTVWSQIAGKYIDGEVVERAHGTSTLYFFAIVVIFTMASLAPKLLSEDDKAIEPKDKEFGPFKASAEMLNGRAAMLGFGALLAVELVKQSPIF